MNEADICLALIALKLPAAGWETEPPFWGYFASEAREILNDRLEKYAADGELQFTLPDVLKVPPISQHGKVNEIIGKSLGALLKFARDIIRKDKGLNGDLYRLPMPPEQRRIVGELDALQAEVDALKRLQAETAAELAARLPALLDKAFKGEL
jgi:hypothetical protein